MTNEVDEAAFIEAIRSNPEDEGSRVVYADWLEERSDPRGEYLRLELTLHNMGLEAQRPTHFAQRLRRDQLADAIDPAWLSAVSRIVSVVLEHIPSGLAQFDLEPLIAEHVEQLHYANPIIREIISKVLLDRMPTVLIRDVSRAEAERVCTVLHQVEGVRATIVPGGASGSAKHRT